ncbi:hypothetical protein K458DRAFT_396702 [Lentithecium fluviatile CBS 122367]|uniref:USP domain-containing protein n=1 Tax=Lentithecium fluviatile CBS 122367 TaxID=1168545 RepID=A0A6G1IEK3_9PLEO|nr:hypothetical protein K458DRAFT_396702 [Lentithecium fluviatile CBS 122367]
MSQRDHGLMEPTAAAEAEAFSVPVSPPQRDSMEDADPSLTRKRPRLDSGSKDTLAMPTDPAASNTASAPPHEQQVEMTIRSQPASSSHTMDGADDSEFAVAAAALGEDTDPEPAVADTDIGPVLEDDDSADSPPVIAIDDDDSDTMVGSTVPSATQIDYDAELHFQRFPFAQQGNYLQAVHNIAQHFHGTQPVDGTVLPQVAIWLDRLPGGPAYWKSYFLDKHIFWDEFAGMINRILQRRSLFGDQFCDDSQTEDDVFTSFFAAYLRVCALLMQADANAIVHLTPDEASGYLVLSCKHIRHLHMILRSEKPHVFGLLEREYRANLDAMTIHLLHAFVRAEGVKSLLTFANMVCGKVAGPMLPATAVWMTQLLILVGSLLQDPESQPPLDRSEYYADVLQFFRSYDAELQVPSKVTDIGNAKDLITHMSILLFHLCQWDSSIAAKMADELLDFRDPDSPTTLDSTDSQAGAGRDTYRQDTSLFPALVMHAWKFKLLRKYVVKGRMELRVMSIGTMDTALVDVWREYNITELSSRHPVMQYLAEFLLHERVTDYIISVDSHPQLISRSGNVVGFLVVTQRYSESQTDAIWNTVSKSSDPRVVSATLTMLRNIFNLMNLPELLYLCTKLYELPIESYNMDILRFLRELTTRIQQKNLDWNTVESKARPWNVSVRVLQDTSPGRDTSKLFHDMHNEAFDQLYMVCGYINPEERHEICRRAATHIASRSRKATGSVRAIIVLTSMLSFNDSLFFLENPDVTRQILEETCTFVKEEQDIASNLSHALQYRLDLLSFLIRNATDAIPLDLYQDIWDHLVGKYAQTDFLRDMAWAKFLDASTGENSFCKQLISVYVPKLEPQYYTNGLFNFVAAYRFPTTRRIVITPEGEKELLQIRGADLLWSMVLSAPQQTIEDQAARLLAARYLELGTEPDVTLEEVEAAHVALVDQCMREILSAYTVLRSKPAEHENDQMDFALAEPVRQQNERRFNRTILFLKGLLNSIRTRPDFNRARRSDSKVEPLDLDLPYGEAVEILYQHPTLQEKQAILVGLENTLQELYTRLCLATGFSKINLFWKGQRLNVAEKANETIAHLGLANTYLLVQKAPGSEVSQPMTQPSENRSVFEAALINQFEELFACMDAADGISLVLYDFLSLFPFPERIGDSVKSGASSVDDLFPPGKPWQSIYTAIALQHRLKEQIKKNTLDDTFLANAVRLLVQALLNPILVSEPPSNSMEIHLAGQLVKVLPDFLRERPAPEISSTYFSNDTRLVDRLLSIISVTLKAQDTDYTETIYHSYASIVEASLHSRGVWEAFTSNANVTVLHRDLLLNPLSALRGHIARTISSVCGGALPPSSALTEADTVACFWALISSVLPEAPRYPAQAEYLLEIADEIFRKYDENHRDEEALRSYLASWSDMLLDYQHVEYVGRDEIDFVVLGFTKLLLSCISSLKSFKKPLNAGSLVERVWNKFLFVPRVVDLDEHAPVPPLPVLESKTRKELYDLVLALAEDRTSYNKLLELAKDVAFDEADMTLKPISIDRTNEIRSPTGYVGLFNPRAICYMNSLLTQLFMNVNFRKFMLGLTVADRGASQRLLHETQKLFANLQNSYRKAADPRDFAACVKVPEGVPIDINVQMDADEFYNLLFDQWEAQMLSPEIRQQFRSFYGGQTVNQIKSKECEHVSERVESFFVVQCDVQGKLNLNESLQAYVEGDVMEGDNKYKCESCGGKLVDAVKRTCLKEVPDNLMFHLKRFDFDLVEMRRSKINDEFQFPAVIDISPFTIDHLSDPSKPRQEDWFELVGVLVHQGTSENGHYYSYIRERPCPSGSDTHWFEFNDREVDMFNHTNIPQSTFGGLFEDTFPRQHKNFSAYMLFYQRRSAIRKDHNQYIGTPLSGIAKVPVPAALEKMIQDDNEGFIREYSLYDPCHTKFARQILTNLRTINHGTCSEDHHQESQALHFVLEYLCQMLFRVRITDIFEEIIPQLRKTMLSCPTCCQIALKWLATSDYALTNVLLQSLYMKVRSQMRALLIDGLQFLREKDPAAYGIEGMDTDGETGNTAPDGILLDIAQRLRMVTDESYLAARGWDDMYLTLCQLSNMGHVETAVLLNEAFLDFCLKIFCMHASQSIRDHDPDMWRMVEKKRRIYNRLIEFVYTLLSKMDINLPIVMDYRRNRLEKYHRHGCKFPLVRGEKYLLLMWHDENRALAALDKMLEVFDHEKTEVFYPGEILKWMLQSQDPRFLGNLHTTVWEGISMLSPPTSDPYVRAALAYCEACPEPGYVEQVIEAVAKAASKLREQGGQPQIRFFSGLLHAENEAVLDERGPDFFYEMSLLCSRRFSIPLLLYEDEGVRRATSNFLQELFTKYKDDALATENTLRLKYRAVRNLASDICVKITDEHEQNTPRSYVQPMISTFQTLILLLDHLQSVDDHVLEQLRHASDAANIQAYQFDLSTLLRHWPLDESTPVSTGEGYEQSDYGSESDIGDDMLAEM